MGKAGHERIVGRLMRDALRGSHPDPDAAYLPSDALAFDALGTIRTIVGSLALSAPAPSDPWHPIPLLLRLHAEGRDPRDLGTAIVQAARIGLRGWHADPDRDHDDDRDLERMNVVRAHLERFRDRDCILDEELAAALAGMGYGWSAFDDAPSAPVGGVRDVLALDRIAATGAHLGHVARCIADARDVDPHGLSGPMPGWGTVAYEGGGVYRLTPDPLRQAEADDGPAIPPSAGRTVRRVVFTGRKGGDLLFRVDASPSRASPRGAGSPPRGH